MFRHPTRNLLNLSSLSSITMTKLSQQRLLSSDGGKKLFDKILIANRGEVC